MEHAKYVTGATTIGPIAAWLLLVVAAISWFEYTAAGDDGVPNTCTIVMQFAKTLNVNVVVVGTVQTKYVTPVNGPEMPFASANAIVCPMMRPCADEVVIVLDATGAAYESGTSVANVKTLGVI